jgi:hypothetical protein
MDNLRLILQKNTKIRMLTIGFSLLTLLTFLFASNFKAGLLKPQIMFWNGTEQEFGRQGRTQRWINILGNISAPEEILKASYTLNGGDPQPLTLGPDLHRLALTGDFNVQLDWNQVIAGINRLTVFAEYKNGETINKQVKFRIFDPISWPLPYSVDFRKVKNLQQVVQVVDGKWKMETDGVRTEERFYDRVLSLGDTSWKNYEALIQLTVHDFTPSSPEPPTYNVTHFGVALRWQGHTTDGRQPSRQWYPLGAQGEFLLKYPDSCQWRILFDGSFKSKPPVYASSRNLLELGKPILIRARVETMEDGKSRYRFRTG